MLWLISFLVILVILLCIPFLSKHGRTISKKNLIILLTISAVFGIFFGIFFNGWNWTSIILIIIPLCVLSFKDFRIVYNVSKNDILEKIKTMLGRLFCKYKNNKKIINIDKIGIIEVYPLNVVTVLIISSSKSPKAQIIFDNIFKIFYDNEY